MKRYITFRVKDKALTINYNRVYTGEIIHEWGNAYRVNIRKADGRTYWMQPNKCDIRVFRIFEAD